MPLDAATSIELVAACFAAGTMDAVAGGGGLIQLPALLAVLPEAAPAALIATNKIASFAGTAGAAVRYSRAMPPPWRMTMAAAAAAFLCSALGAWLLAAIPAALVRRSVPLVMLGVLALAAGHRLGEVHEPHAPSRGRTLAATGGSGLIGLYDGLLGPGAGTFYQLLFVRLLRFDFLHAAAPARLANLASNVAAILVLGSLVDLSPLLVLFMAAANFGGGQLGSHLALLRGNRLVRRAFFLVSALLLARALWTAYRA